MIVSGGENVFPKEVEDVLAGHEAGLRGGSDRRRRRRVRQAAPRLRGPRRGQPDDPDKMTDTLKAHVKDNLARYKVPRDFVYLDELPRNATGKIVKRELAERDEQDEQERRQDRD
jgi:fatty-acyl-CoA synthase